MNILKKHKKPDKMQKQKQISVLLLKKYTNLKGLSKALWTLLFYLNNRGLLINVKQKLAILLQM